MSIEFDDFSASSKGGTEIIKHGLLNRLPKDLLSKFQIISDRIQTLDEDKIRIFWSHLTPDQSKAISEITGAESEPLANGKWKRFHKIIFISHHQMEEWISKYNIPRSHCTVIKYALESIELQEKPKDKIVLIYHSSPNRGLDILVDAFCNLCEEYDNLELKVHSSFITYGQKKWQDDFESTKLHSILESHPKIKNIGHLPNEEIKKSLASSHIFAYPNSYVETFCLSLLEAMSAGLLCVHPNYGCLPETASNWTMMYDYQDKRSNHIDIFYQNLKKAIEIVNQKETQEHLKKQKEYVDYLFNWDRRTQDWINLLENLKNSPNNKISTKTSLSYH